MYNFILLRACEVKILSQYHNTFTKLSSKIKESIYFTKCPKNYSK